MLNEPCIPAEHHLVMRYHYCCIQYASVLLFLEEILVCNFFFIFLITVILAS